MLSLYIDKILMFLHGRFFSVLTKCGSCGGSATHFGTNTTFRWWVHSGEKRRFSYAMSSRKRLEGSDFTDTTTAYAQVED